jgi:hypothetical protein
VACRDVRLRDDQAADVAAAAVRAYRGRMWEFAEASPLDIWAINRGRIEAIVETQ